MRSPHTRRDLLRFGAGTLLGLPPLLTFGGRALGSPARAGGKGFGSAKSVILVFLQGGPSHIDLWDPKDDVPDDVRSSFKTIASKVPGMEVTELLPRLAQVTDKLTFVRSMSYTPVGLFNHTAAHYQMLTGYTADKVSPSGQLEPPSPKDFPNFGSHISRLMPPTVATLPYVTMPRPLQESNVIGKAGTGGFLGRAFDPYTLFPSGDDTDQSKMDRIKVDDLALRPELSVARLARRAKMRGLIGETDADVGRAVERFDLDDYTDTALELVLSGRAREAFDIQAEPKELRDRYGRNTFGQSCLLARRFVEAGTRVVQVNWSKPANSDLHSWDVHLDLQHRMRDLAAPMLDPALATLIEDLDERGLLDETLVVAVGEFGRSPRKGLSTSGNDNDADSRDHWPYCFTAVVAGGGVKRGHVHGASDETGSAPIAAPVHPTDLLATIYHAIGIEPHTQVMNHLNQPRELVKGQPVLDLFA
ncbi:hypothetical protein Poly30_13070 [Planctomycetes bacterium Poly30]|uniref:Sulfatase n=1 Tax=Saltatorellus ferox TaxID=2528018 RepID=A0A518ENY8_9BACT|nr:hypothetical protein Poly30_13070 [Planctomycetes bacterium Poly30]